MNKFGCFIFKKIYTDPFEKNAARKMEIVEILDIAYYKKRKRKEGKEAENVEVKYRIHHCDIKDENIFINNNLTPYTYLELLLNKEEKIKNEFNYKCTDEQLVTISYSVVDHLNDLHYRILINHIQNILGIYQNELNYRFLLSSMREGVESDNSEKMKEQLSLGGNIDFSTMVRDPYKK